jgi:hypothetical protein
MTNRFAYLGYALLVALVIPAAGQTQPAKKAPAAKPAAPGKYNPPRQQTVIRIYQAPTTLPTLTPLERMPGTNLVMTKEEAAKEEATAVALKQQGDEVHRRQSGRASQGRRRIARTFRVTWAATTAAGSIRVPRSRWWMARSARPSSSIRRMAGSPRR